jgi:cyclic lactone autoinducer peptide
MQLKQRRVEVKRMKIRLKSMKWLICTIAATLMLIASTSVSSACSGYIYQPKIPKALKK